MLRLLNLLLQIAQLVDCKALQAHLLLRHCFEFLSIESWSGSGRAACAELQRGGKALTKSAVYTVQKQGKSQNTRTDSK